MKNQPYFKPKPTPSSAQRPVYLSLLDTASGDIEPPTYEEVAATDDVTVVRTDPDSVASIQSSIGEVVEGVRQLLGGARARTIWISTLGSKLYRLRAPLPVELDRDDDGSVVIQNLDLEAYGSGESEFEAAERFRRAVVDDFAMLLSEEARLGSHPAELLQRYRDLIEVTA